MALELIAAIVAAIALGGLAYALRRLSGGRLPKWIITAAAAVGLIGFTIWSEYDWFNRVSAELPPGVQVVWHSAAAMPLRPWTYVFPITTTFVAMDVGKMAQHPANPALKLAPLYNFARWQPVKTTAMVVDCASLRQVLITEGVEISDDGLLTGAEWVVPAADDGFQKAACAAG
jgi:hypothetical protein